MSTERAARSTGGGLSLTSIVGVVFVILKLTHVIDWSWWGVLCPFWLGFELLLVFLALSVVFLGLGSVVGVLAENAELRRFRKRIDLWERKDAEWNAQKETGK